MKLDYRPDIDGLRAIAVLSVVLYHAKFSIFGIDFLQGGFLGVDIFFVISGYLITKQILLELKRTEKFSFFNFYVRRIKRLIPALFFITFVTLIIGNIILLPLPLVQFTESIIYQLGFISNFNFWHHYHFGYMTEHALRVPFLHTWSLSLEEQFYFFFPIFLIFIFKFFKKYLFISILICFVVSLSLSQYSSSVYKSLTFYMLPFRGWELLAGSLVAYLKIYLINRSKKSYNNFFSNILIFSSFFIIILYLFFFNGNFSHPSFNTFFLILSVSIIIWFDKNQNLITKFLSTKFLIAFGLISYSLYLWHYPLFAFARHIHGPYFEEMTSLKLLIISISIILSIFTFYFIEKTFRKKNLNIKKLISFLSVFLILILTSSFFIIKNKGFESRLGLTEYQREILNTEGYSVFKKSDENEVLKKDKRNKVLIIGNSHGKDFYETLASNETLSKKYNIKYFFTQVHCIENIVTTGQNVCQRTFNRDKLKTLKDIKNFEDADIVVLKTRWYKETLDSLENTIKYLKTTNKKIVLISDFASFKNASSISYSKPKKFNKNFQQRTYYLEKFPLERFILENNKFPNKNELIKVEKDYYSFLEKQVLKNNIFLKKMADKHEITFLDHLSLVCDLVTKSCVASTPNKEIIHRDTAGHVTKEGANYLSRKIEEKEWFKIE